MSLQKRSKKTLAVSGCLIVIVVAGGIIYTLGSRQRADTNDQIAATPRGINDVDYGAPTDASTKGLNDPKSGPSIAVSPSPQASQQAGTPTVAPSSDVSITLTEAQQDGDTFYIRALVNGTTSGNCTLNLIKSGQSTIQRTAKLQAQADYVICQGFNVPVSDIATSGDWTARVTVTSTSGSSVASENKSVRITK